MPFDTCKHAKKRAINRINVRILGLGTGGNRATAAMAGRVQTRNSQTYINADPAHAKVVLVAFPEPLLLMVDLEEVALLHQLRYQ